MLPNQLSSTKYLFQYTLIILCKFQSQFSIKSPLIKCFLLKNRRMIEQPAMYNVVGLTIDTCKNQIYRKLIECALFKRSGQFNQGF